jgi:helitron helicase-like protein
MSKVTIRTKQKAWNKTRQLLESLTAEDLRKAAVQEQRYHKIDNPAVLELLKSLGQIGSATSGSDEKKSYMFTELKSSFVYYGCPIIYLTINPGDRHSPLALLYAGANINVDKFMPEEYSFTDRVSKLLQNPLSVVEYFHNTIQGIVEGVLKKGLFGEVTHYYGTIEYQGRFTPHMHMAVCLPVLMQLKANLYLVVAQRTNITK